jgi:hypothetical protein
MADHLEAWRAKFDAEDPAVVRQKLRDGLYSERRATAVREWLDEPQPATEPAEPKEDEPAKKPAKKAAKR